MRLLPLLWLCACTGVVTDPSNTGVAVAPQPGDKQAPVDLVIANHTDGVLRCVVFEEELCPSLGTDLTVLAALPARARWVKKDVSCLLADFACYAEDAAENDPPLRAWTWSVDDFGL